MKQSILFLLALFLFSNLQAQTADKVFRNGKVYTANDAQPFAEAIAVKDGKFVFVGSNVDVADFIGSETIVENLKGRLILPGIHDVHMHPLEAGSPIGGDCILNGEEEDPEEWGFELGECNLQPNSNGWIMAFGHSVYSLYDATRPPKEILDDYYPNTPMVVMEQTSHSVWVNSKALEKLNITAATESPTGGHIFKDELTGEPTGILMDNAGDSALSSALKSNGIINNQNYDGLVNYSLPLLAENGITSICEARTYWKRNYIKIWKDIKAKGLLTARVNLAPWIYPSDLDEAQIPILQSFYEDDDDMLKVSQIKLYTDGIIVNATSAMHEPYLDNLGLPFNRGLNYIDAERLTKLITILEKIGYDFHIHAIGDRGVTEAINSIEAARNTNGNLGARHRITHVEIVKPSDYTRFKPLNITADMQVAGEFTCPEHWNENNFLLGEERTKAIVPLKSIYETGARVTLSSDWDVSDLNPFVGIEHAVTRAPQELPSVEEAVKAYTINGAYVMRQESKTGSIEVGKLADFICVDKDIFTIPHNQIHTTQVLSTNLEGEEIYRSSILSIDNHATNLIKLFPNPSKHSIQLDFSDLKSKVRSVSVYSIDSSLITSFEVAVRRSEKLEVNVSEYAEGVYVLQLELENGEKVGMKFVRD